MSKSIISILVLAAAFAFAFGPTAATAAPCSEIVPATNSELDQYVETIPGACGDTQVGGGGPDGGASTGGGGSGGGDPTAGAAPVVPLAASTEAALDELGPDGVAAAALAERTTPSPDGDGDGGAGGAGTDAALGSELPSSSVGFSPGSALEGILSAFGGGSGSGLGVGAPILLGAIALGGLAFLLLRRRSLG